MAATGAAVYVQGHQRWLDNPNGRDIAGPGAVSPAGHRRHRPGDRQGAALEPDQGPRRRRQGLLVTPRGLWVGSDTDRIGDEFHNKIALLPVP